MGMCSRLEIGITDNMTDKQKQIQTITDTGRHKKYEGTNVIQTVEKKASRNRHVIQSKKIKLMSFSNL